MVRVVGLLVVSLLIAPLAGCDGVAIRPGMRFPIFERHGPPPHAPAHGHRHRHSGGVELEFDSGFDIYVVIGETDIYFRDDQFVRIRSGIWEVSANLGGPWDSRDRDWAPPGRLDQHSHHKAKKNHPHHKAKKEKKHHKHGHSGNGH